MKYEYMNLPNFIQNEDGTFEVYNYTKLLVPIPENKNDEDWLNEK